MIELDPQNVTKVLECSRCKSALIILAVELGQRFECHVCGMPYRVESDKYNGQLYLVVE